MWFEISYGELIDLSFYRRIVLSKKKIDFFPKNCLDSQSFCFEDSETAAKKYQKILNFVRQKENGLRKCDD